MVSEAVAIVRSCILITQILFTMAEVYKLTRVSPRDINWHRARVTATGYTDTPSDTEEFVAYDQKGTHVVISDATKLSLYRCNFSPRPPFHSIAWRMPLPEGIDNFCYKALNDTTLAVQKRVELVNNTTLADQHVQLFSFEEAAPTFFFSLSDKYPESTGPLDNVGRLRGVLGKQFVYAKQRSGVQDDFIIRIPRRGGRGEMTLKPPGLRKWGHGISVCRTSVYIIVVQCFGDMSVDVFSETEEHIGYKALMYVPRGHSAITTCGPRHVMVAQAEPPALHIYKLPTVEMIRTYNHVDLGLGGKDSIKAVQYNEHDGIIHLTTGNQNIHNTLRTYKVE